MNFKIYRILHLILTGIITIPITIFLAAGAIGENYTESFFVDPELLLLIVLWFIGAVISFHKRFAKYGLIISALPIIFFVGAILYSIISGFFI
ncbi:hypothetical protein [Metabacillus litoralis]|uniref:hypothetical protein n=1 Tax=Metabacillus litoralis TaxID=152268 RepID=UPI001CFEBF51|nr:hypothetical protein [Metabacillus litoralis]